MKRESPRGSRAKRYGLAANPKEVLVSVLLTMRVQGDTQKFREFMASGADVLERPDQF